MDTQESQYVSTRPHLEALFDWGQDIARFEREVDAATSDGTDNSLTLAEMECSIDLIDAELMAWRGHQTRNEDIKSSIAELAEHRCQLARLIERLRPLVPEHE